MNGQGENGRYPVRLIATDMDGTLLDACSRISEENVRALALVQEQGITVCICTGRMVADAAEITQRAGLTCAIAGVNGAHIVDAQGRTLYSAKIGGETARALYMLLRPSGLRLNAVFDRFVVTIAQPGDTWRYPPAHRGVIQDKLGEEALMAHVHEGLYKLVLMGEPHDERLAQARAQVEACFPALMVTSSYCDNIEIGAAGTGKGEALRRLCGQLEIPLQSAMALGDEENDLPMLRLAGYSVAMGNASQMVREACRYKTEDNVHAGVARAVRRLALGQWMEEGREHERT